MRTIFSVFSAAALSIWTANAQLSFLEGQYLQIARLEHTIVFGEEFAKLFTDVAADLLS